MTFIQVSSSTIVALEHISDIDIEYDGAAVASLYLHMDSGNKVYVRAKSPYYPIVANHLIQIVESPAAVLIAIGRQMGK